jgi:hypothetical protein
MSAASWDSDWSITVVLGDGNHKDNGQQPTTVGWQGHHLARPGLLQLLRLLLLGTLLCGGWRCVLCSVLSLEVTPASLLQAAAIGLMIVPPAKTIGC